MDALAKVFGGGKKGEPPTPQQAIVKLRETEEMLTKKSDFVEKGIANALAIARKNGTKNKAVSLKALRKKKRLEKELNQIDGTLSTIEFQREALENAHTNTEVLKNMSYAAKALKAAHQHLNADDVADIIDDIKDQNNIADEISTLISQPVAAGFDDIDGDELLEELEQLELEGLKEDLLDVGEPSNRLDPLDDLPPVPTATPKKPEVQKEDKDLRELAAWAS